MKHLDDCSGRLVPNIELEELGCWKHELPLIAREKPLRNKKAGRQFFLMCPECGKGFKVISSLVVKLKPVKVPEEPKAPKARKRKRK